MNYDEIVRRSTREQMFEILDLADRLSMLRSGFPVRSYQMIRSGTIPFDDDLSRSSDRLMNVAVWLHGRGQRSEPLAGKEPEEVLSTFRPIMAEGAVEIAEDYIGIEQGLERVFGRKSEGVVLS